MRLLLIDDHKMFIDGLLVSLKTLPNIQFVTVQNSARSALDHLEEGHIYHMIMLDLNMPDLDGFQFMDTLIDRGFHFPVVILSGSENPKDFIRLRDYGIAGYISKSSDINDLNTSLQAIANGQTVIPKKYAAYFSANYKEDETIEKAKELKLSRRKLEIITCIADGMTNKQIAEKLFVAKSTIDHHIKEIFRRLNVNSRVECINKAKSTKLL